MTQEGSDAHENINALCGVGSMHKSCVTCQAFNAESMEGQEDGADILQLMANDAEARGAKAEDVLSCT